MAAAIGIDQPRIMQRPTQVRAGHRMLNQAPAATRKILLVDDHPIVRLGCISLLRQINPTSEFYEADDQEQALQLARRLAPCVALVDLSLAGTLTLDLIKLLRVHAPQMAILVVSMHDEKHYAERALRAGAQGYVMKQIAASSIIQAVQTVCSMDASGCPIRYARSWTRV